MLSTMTWWHLTLLCTLTFAAFFYIANVVVHQRRGVILRFCSSAHSAILFFLFAKVKVDWFCAVVLIQGDQTLNFLCEQIKTALNARCLSTAVCLTGP